MSTTLIPRPLPRLLLAGVALAVTLAGCAAPEAEAPASTASAPATATAAPESSAGASDGGGTVQPTPTATGVPSTAPSDGGGDGAGWAIPSSVPTTVPEDEEDVMPALISGRPAPDWQAGCLNYLRGLGAPGLTGQVLDMRADEAVYSSDLWVQVEARTQPLSCRISYDGELVAVGQGDRAPDGWTPPITIGGTDPDTVRAWNSQYADEWAASPTWTVEGVRPLKLKAPTAK